jgi:glutamyl-tRNA reductase
LIHGRRRIVAIVLIGLNYRTAPVELRERLALAGCSLRMALEDLLGVAQESRGDHAITESVILSTCNRLEVYACAHQAQGGMETLEHFLGGLQNIPPGELAPHLYRACDDAAIEHLMRVACGLDSMILGEPQILGQVTQSFEDAHAAGTTGPILSHLFAHAIHIGKRARTETDISRHTTSVSHVGAQKVIDELSFNQSRRILIVGAGEMAMIAAEVLQRAPGVELSFINRTYSRAEAAAVELKGKALAWHQLEEGLVWADAVVSATGAPHTVIYRKDVEEILPARAGRRLVIVDVSVPRDVEDTVRDVAGVAYHDIDDLQSVLDAHLELRRAAIPQVMGIICEGSRQFSEWLNGRQVTPVIRTLRDWAQGIAAEELAQALARMPQADPATRRAVERLAHRLVNRMLHEPTTRLRLQAADGNGYGYAHAVRELFALSNLDHLRCPRAGEECTSSGHADGATHRCTLECIVPPVQARQA